MMSLQQSEITSIRNILTLRYNPEEQGPLPHKIWTEFSPTESDPEGSHVEDLLYMAIVNNLIKYDKIGIALSSGVDSSLILALIRHGLPEKKIIAIHYTGVNNDELDASKKLADKFHCEFQTLAPTPVYERIPKMFQMLNAPKWDAYDYIIPETASKIGCDVLVTGDGADVLYAGYTFRYQKFESKMHIGNNPISKISHLIYDYLDCHFHDYVEDQEKLFQIPFDWELNIEPYLWPYFSNPLELLQKVILADYNGKLCHNFMIKSEAFSKQFNIPIVAPFLEESIRDFASHVPLREKYHNGVGKLPLRKICNRFGIEPPLKKLGFTHDIKSEWKTHVVDYIKPLLNPQSLIYSLGIINPLWVQQNMDQAIFVNPERVINKFVSLYTLELYLQWKQK